MSVIELWCDAGGNNTTDRVGGIGVVLIYKGTIKILCEGYEDTTNNRMEMTAVIRALQSLKKKDMETEVYSDSAYVVNCFIQGWYHKWRENEWQNSKGKDVENQDLWLILIDLYESLSRTFFNHVKGHSGVKYNELADLLATIAISRISHGLTNQDIIDIIENKDKKPKREFIAKYNLSAKQWTDFSKKGKDWLELLKTSLY